MEIDCRRTSTQCDGKDKCAAFSPIQEIITSTKIEAGDKASIISDFSSNPPKFVGENLNQMKINDYTEFLKEWTD